MTDEIKLQEAVKKTQDLLGKYIKKPPLTDKLLRKPPFRFIHDMITSIIKETGFLKNLYREDELVSTNIADKEAKIEYLTKLIDAVKLITANNELSARPSKIISGQEPIKTNELFHAIGRALDKKVSSDEAIEHYKNNLTKKSKEKTLKKKSSSPEVNLTTSNEKINAKKTVKKSTDSRVGSKESEKKKSSQTKPSGESRKRDNSIDRKTGDSKSTKDSLKKKESTLKKKEVEKKPEKRVRSKETSGSKKEVALPKTTEEPTQAQNKKDSIITDSKEETKDLVEEKAGESLDNNLQVNPTVESNAETTEPVVDKTEDIVKENADKAEPEQETKVQRLKKQSKSVELIDNKVEENKNSGIVKTSSGFLRPPTARPPSARPAAPRMRGKTDFIINTNGANQIADINVVVQNFDLKEDDSEDMVVVETTINDDSSLLISNGNNNNNNNNNNNADWNDKQLTQEHGYLVAQILETQRELVNEDNIELIPNKIEIEWESGVKKDRDFVAKEIDKLRGTIQSLTRTTNPLGKLFDFLQEDVEIMQRELRDWRNQFIEIREQLIVEKSKTLNVLKPLEDSLNEVENNIKSQMEKIYQTKSNVLKNNLKISRLLSGQ